MKLIPYEKKKLGNLSKRSDIFKMLMDFHNDSLDCVEIKEHNYSSVKSCQNTLTQSIKRYHLNEIRVVIRGEKVFLVKV